MALFKQLLQCCAAINNVISYTCVWLVQNASFERRLISLLDFTHSPPVMFATPRLETTALPLLKTHFFTRVFFFVIFIWVCYLLYLGKKLQTRSAQSGIWHLSIWLTWVFAVTFLFNFHRISGWEHEIIFMWRNYGLCNYIIMSQIKKLHKKYIPKANTKVTYEQRALRWLML